MTRIANIKPEDGAEHRGGADWKFALLGGLAGSEARRVFTAAQFHRFVQGYRPSASAGTARTMSNRLVAAGALRRVSNGIFLNRRAVPPSELMEAAAHIRAGAVISLHSVLGEVGFLNNPPSIVVAVLPTSTTKRPTLGEVKTSAGDIFRFYGLAERFFARTDEERFELLQPSRPCAMFRPEAALLQWLHLANMQRSSLTAPPLDVDMDTLDHELLLKLALRWRLSAPLEAWHARAKASDFGQEPAPSETFAQPTQEAREASAAARARLMARRTS